MFLQRVNVLLKRLEEQREIGRLPEHGLVLSVGRVLEVITLILARAYRLDDLLANLRFRANERYNVDCARE